jgi:NAD(P)-dependent dehydrogenase (short-subunit alcohol dehydrogenase family)
MKRTWLITGASRGLGAMIAQTVLAHGDSVVATAWNKNSLNPGADKTEVLTFSLDVTNEEQAKTAVQAAVERFGGIDVLMRAHSESTNLREER